MTLNYRVIAVSILDGSLYNMGEFRDLKDATDWGLAAINARWDVHCIFVAIDGDRPHVMGINVSR